MKIAKITHCRECPDLKVLPSFWQCSRMDFKELGDVYGIPTWCPLPDSCCSTAKFRKGDMVRKVSGSAWHGKIVGTYSTQLTPEGYAVESHFEPGSVQIYPAKALEAWKV